MDGSFDIPLDADFPTNPPSDINIRSFWFHDRVVGFAVGESGRFYRTDDDNTIDHSAFGWEAVPVNLSDDIDGQTFADCDINTIGFSERFNGFIGGSSTTGPVRYARTLRDEMGLFSARFWYDAVGRIVLSQNSKQKQADPQRFSYSFYDKLGRVYEAGEVDDLTSTDPNTAGAFRNALLGNLVGGTFDPSVLDAELLKGWVVGLNRREVTHTWYDEPIPGNTLPSYFVQRNLRMRVASTTFQEEYNEDPTVYDHASHYSYDIHGNVADLLQDHPQLDLDGGGVGLGHRFKRMLYHYDLISGNVKEVWYQPRKPDAMYHRYDYDADNRITRVETSVDRQNWYIDAEYMYYPHGPLERMELGQSKVQGVDYAYTLQGWLKGINSERLVPANDMGLDGVVAVGNENAAVGRDAFGMSLGYYGDGDYEAIDGTRWDNSGGTRPFAPVGTTGTLSAAHNPLYNGNIAHTVNTLQPFGTWTGTSGEQGQVLAQVYRYDQLNRLREAQGVQGLDADNTWNGVLDATANRYRSEYTFDANGNIETTQRWDQNGTQYDDFSYHYPGTEPQTSPTAVPSKRTGNRLHQLYDESMATTGTDIATNPSTFLPGEFPVWDADINTDYNYGYDALGNLIRDDEADIEAIEWTVAGKVKAVESSSNDALRNLTFGYSASGNRIMKQVGPDPTGTGLGFREHYIRDAQGNIMAVYRYDNNDGLSLKLNQRPMYGSSRLGTYDREKQLHGQDLLTPPSVYSIPTEFMSAADRRYELTDHLGNVSAVVTGQLIPGNGATPFQPVLISAQGYEAFGSIQPEMNYSSSSYDYGFNGMPKDEQMYEFTGTSYDFGARLLDVRVGRWLSLDPKFYIFPQICAYSFAGLNPIRMIDPDGRIIFPSNPKSKENYNKAVMKVFNDNELARNLLLISEDQHSVPEISESEYNAVMTQLSSPELRAVFNGLSLAANSETVYNLQTISKGESGFADNQPIPAEELLVNSRAGVHISMDNQSEEIQLFASPQVNIVVAIDAAGELRRGTVDRQLEAMVLGSLLSAFAINDQFSHDERCTTPYSDIPGITHIQSENIIHRAMGLRQLSGHDFRLYDGPDKPGLFPNDSQIPRMSDIPAQIRIRKARSVRDLESLKEHDITQ